MHGQRPCHRQDFIKGLEAECLVTPESFAEKQAKKQQAGVQDGAGLGGARGVGERGVMALVRAIQTTSKSLLAPLNVLCSITTPHIKI